MPTILEGGGGGKGVEAQQNGIVGSFDDDYDGGDADFEEKDKINLVGGDLLKYGSKCLLELQITPSGNRRAIIKKHRHLPAEKEITFKIVEGGILGTKEGKGFRFFK